MGTCALCKGTPLQLLCLFFTQIVSHHRLPWMRGNAGAPKKQKPAVQHFPHANASHASFVFEADDSAAEFLPALSQEASTGQTTSNMTVPHFDYDRTRCEALVWVAKGIAMRQCGNPKKHGDPCGTHRTSTPHGTVWTPALVKVQEP